MSSEMQNIIIIPARYASTRFHAKLLAVVDGKSIIRRTYEQAMKTKAHRVVVAADHEKIFEEVSAFGGEVVMTSNHHPSGTDRIFEAAQKILDDSQNHIIINLQGDEPLMPPDMINDLINMMNSNENCQMATIAVKVPRAEIENDPNKVKVVKSSYSSKALYFTRASAPFLRKNAEDCGTLLHWGIYAYRFNSLAKIVSLPESPLEKCEKLEQLRALEAGIDILILETEQRSYGVDVPEDLEIVRNIIKNTKKTGNVC